MDPELSNLAMFDFVKAVGADGEPGRIVGLATVETEDYQGETVLVSGLDLDYLRTNGKINYDHGKGAGDWIGRVTKVRTGIVRDIVPREYQPMLRDPSLLRKPGLWVEGDLYEGVAAAESTRKALRNDDHGWGISLQGSTTKRDPKVPSRISGAAVFHVSVTPQAVNTNTFAALAKSLSTSYLRQDQTGGQAMAPESMGGTTASTITQTDALRRFARDVRRRRRRPIDGCRAGFWVGQGFDGQVAKSLARACVLCAGALRKAYQEDRTMAKCERCGADLKGNPLCTACGAFHGEEPMEALQKALAEEMSDEELAALAAEDNKPEGEGDESDEEKAKKKLTAFEGKKNAEEEPAEAQAGDEGVEKSLGADGVDVTEIMQRLIKGMDAQDVAREVMGRALLETVVQVRRLAKSVSEQAATNQALATRLGVLADVPLPRGGRPVNVTAIKKSFADTAQPEATTEADAETNGKIQRALTKGLLTPEESVALDRRQVDRAALVKSIEARTGEKL